MPHFLIETSYHLPVFRRKTYEAPTLEDACRQALEDDDWSDEKHDHNSAGQTYISGAWSGENAAYTDAALPIPFQFDECIQRKADQFDALIAVLTSAVQHRDRSRDDFERWLPRARALLVKAEAIRNNRPDPDPASV